MKKLGLMFLIIMVTTLLSTAVCFADGGSFSIQNTYPEDGQGDTSQDNLCIKIFLDSDTTFEKTLESQKDRFALVSADGETTIPFGMQYDPNEHIILIFAYNEENNTTQASDVGVEGDTEYKAVISKDLVDDNGRTLSVDKEHADENGNYSITFKTQNMTTTMTVNMIMMGVMFVGILFFSARSAKKAKQKEEDEKQASKKKTNPYDEARRTGKSVEAIIAKQEKKKAKAEKREEAIRLAKEKEDAEIQAILEAEIRASYYQVKGPRPISAAGGQYKSGRKAKAEAKAKAEEKKRKAAQAKAKSKKSKGKKK